MPNDEPNLVPLSVAACSLGVQPRELRAEIEAGGLPHARVGERAILVDLDLIRDLLCERASGRANCHDAAGRAPTTLEADQ